jgi:hypothetical protein
MRRSSLFAGLLCTFLLAAAPAMAQDFGKSWIDRVTHTMIEDEATLSPQKAQWNFVAGELYSYDSNIFLSHDNEESDSIFTTFAGLGVKVAELSWDAEADLLINYNLYASNDDINADEERFFGRIRYQGTKLTLSVAEIFRRETSPTDAVFTTRVSRWMSNTTPMVIFKASEVFAFELTSDLQLVNYLRSQYQTIDNFNTRTLLTLAYTTGMNGLDLLLQGGFWGITYQDSSAAPDSDGFIARLGVRGELSPTLQLVALVGVANADSGDYAGTTTNAEMTTADVDIHLAFSPSENTTWYADYSRRFGFSAEGAAWQVVDSAGVSGTFAAREDLKFRARLDYSRVHSDLGLRRSYYSFGVGAEWKVHPHVLLDAGLTYRAGVTPGIPNDAGDFDDVIISLGAAIVF